MAMPAPFPSVADVPTMPVDRLALHVLWYLADTRKYKRRVEFIFDRLREGNRSAPARGKTYTLSARDLTTPVATAWGEAWEWLIARGLVTEQLGTSDDRWGVSRLGLRIAADAEPLTHVSSLALLGADLHAQIAKNVRLLFAQGLYDLAAFESMKQVEVRVRELAKADASDIGVPLMRKVFHPTTGPLTDPAQEKGEREATAALYAGAIGTFKNPTSHRQVRYDDPVEASDVVRLADLLLRILDRRAQAMKAEANAPQS
jgi:uncharacterized protein (TIGR02391 family)